MDEQADETLAAFVRKNLVSPTRIVNKLKIDLEAYETAIDNLLRVRCVSSNVEYRRYSPTESYAGSRGDLLNYADYDLVCLTPLGLRFVSACTGK